VKKFREISVTQLKIKATDKEKIQSVKQMHLDNCSRRVAALWTTKDHWFAPDLSLMFVSLNLQTGFIPGGITTDL
jgi:hypothetical protein